MPHINGVLPLLAAALLCGLSGPARSAEVSDAAEQSEAPLAPLLESAGLVSYAVDRVVDGDTIRVLIGDESVSVRIIGLDTPETVHPNKPVEYFGKEASARAHLLLDGQRVFLLPDQGDAGTAELPRDRYGRLLAHVWREDGLLFAFDMIVAGYAFDYPKYPYREDYMELFQAAETYARVQELGLWAER